MCKVRLDTRGHMCVDMRIGMRVDISVDMCVDMRVDMSVAMCAQGKQPFHSGPEIRQSDLYINIDLMHTQRA